MREFRFRFLMIIAFVGLSLYLLYPTYQDYSYDKEISEKIVSIKDSLKQSTPVLSDAEIKDIVNLKENSFRSVPEVKDAREKRVKLGLDLQGGMYLVMEVNTAKLLERLVKDGDDPQFKDALAEAEKISRTTNEDVVSTLANIFKERNIRMSRYFGSIREDDEEIIARLKEQESDAVTRAIEIIRNRVDQYGVSEPSIQKQGSRRIIVELPGVAKEEEAKNLVQGRALLEFKLVKESDFAFPIMNRIDEVLAGDVKKDSTEVRDSLSTEELSEEQFAKEHPFFAVARLADPQGRIPDTYVKESDKAIVQELLSRPEVKNIVPDNIEFIYHSTPIVGDDGENYYRMYMVNKQPELTGGVIVDAQSNIDPQTTGAVVYMQMNAEGAREWARITGANIDKRCAIVLDGVVYSAPNILNKIPGGSSSITGLEGLEEAKLLEIVLKAGALPAPVDIIEERTVGPSLGQDSISQGFNSTLIGFLLVAIFMIVYYKKTGTLADLALTFTIIFIMGILAGFQATLTLPGIAGIILTIGMAVDANVIIFERIREEQSTGKTNKASIESGFQNSYSAIFDANITSFFTAVILYQFGSGPIQGFALTLMIGIIASLFSSLVITKLMMEFMVAKGFEIKVGGRSRIFDGLHIDFLGKRKIAYAISATLMIIGIASLAFRGLELGIDFKGGSEIALGFEKPIEISDVRQSLEGIGLGNVEVKTFGGETGVLIRTELQEVPKELIPQILVNIENELSKSFPNLQKTFVDSSYNSISYDLGDNEVTNQVVDKLVASGYLASRASLEPDNTVMQLRFGIANLLEETLKDKMPDNSFTILKEENVGPKIGNELKRDALIAVGLSLLVILLYLGLRFKFAFANGAVAALFHDVLITLGLFSILYGTVSFLNLEISISVVAAFLTLVGYSINDTVIVFDRVREELKVHKTAPLEENINRAINLTMRRTLITSLTTLMVVTVLLFFGGEVLRGFAFTLFFGIIIGTYSSVFVASAFVLEYATKTKKKMTF